MAGDIKVVGLGRGRMVWGDIDLVDQDADDIQIVPAFFCHRARPDKDALKLLAFPQHRTLLTLLPFTIPFFCPPPP